MYSEPALLTRTTEMTLQGSTIDMGGQNLGAVDTGTTLIGGPEAVIDKMYSAIPGSTKMGGSYGSYYEYPCNTSIDFQITIAGYTVKITDADFNLGRYSDDDDMCTGAAFIQRLPSNAPVQWIIGDTVLKNAYTVFRYDPPGVGFATLAAGLSDSQDQQTAIPVISNSTSALGASDNSTSSSASSSSSKSSTSSSPTPVQAQEPVVTVTEGADANSAAVSPTQSGSAASGSPLGVSLLLASLGLSWLAL